MERNTKLFFSDKLVFTFKLLIFIGSESTINLKFVTFLGIDFSSVSFCKMVFMNLTDWS